MQRTTRRTLGLAALVLSLAVWPTLAQDLGVLDEKAVKGAEKHYSPYVGRNIPDRIMAGNGRNRPPSSGRKYSVSGRNGAVSVACSPIAQRGLLAATSCNAATSARPIEGPTTITEVALRRPREIRSRMARLTPSASP